jgi:hypothetical protein
VSAPVDLFVSTADLPSSAVAGVDVSVFDPSTFAFVTSAVTDANGRAAFLLPDAPGPGMLYEVRFYKMGFVFNNPGSIAVISSPAVNKFDVSCTQVGVFGIPVDPLVCRCVGRFLSISNTPLVNAMVRISAVVDQLPAVVGGNLAPAESSEFHTDQHGFIVADLVRSRQYYVSIAGETDRSWPFYTPDRPSANLIDLIHPVPVSIEFPTLPPPPTVTLAVGEQVAVPVVLTFSDYRTTSQDLTTFVEMTNSDSTVVDAALMNNGDLILVGKVPGTVTLTTALGPNLTPTRIPSTQLSAPILTVTVTP